MALTNVQQRITHQIRCLHARREPLNIAAVKRNRSKLIRAVYAIKPFWGWKQALEAAGLSYGKINVELRDYVTCRICGTDLGLLTFHLLLRHEVTPEEYRKEFPGAEILSELVRAKQGWAKRRKSKIPNWEDIWSPEYILDRIAELKRRGFPLHFDWIGKHEKSLGLGAIRCFDSWDNALRRVGLDPCEIRLCPPGKSWNREKVIASLQERRRKGLPVNEAALSGGDGNTALINAVRRYFGTLKKALREAGIDPRQAYLRPWAYSDRQIQNMLAAVKRAAQLPAAECRKAWPALKARYNKVAISSRFGNWTKVFQAAGVLRERFMPGARFPDKASILDALRKRQKEGLPINARSIFLEDRNLYQSALRHFGRFDPIYPLLGVRKSLRFGTPKGVTMDIRKRKRVGKPTGSAGLRSGKYRDEALLSGALRRGFRPQNAG
jgi:hypothetical protein